MANDLTTRDSLPPAIADRGIDPEVWSTLKGAIYPGADDSMVLLAMDYCKSRNLDIMKKPVHIVSTWDNKAKKSVQTLWEGIGSLRITAARTGQYAGMDEPEFGDPVTENIGGETLTFPEWCRVTVYRIVAGHRVPFTSKLYWVECYAPGYQGKGANQMWTKRKYAQLAKCAEADALRKAFPEEVGSQPTAEEMEGRELVDDYHKRPIDIADTEEAVDAIIEDVQNTEDTEPAREGGSTKPAGERVALPAGDNAPADFDNSNLTEAQKGLVKVAKCGINGLQDVWQAYEVDEKKAIGGAPFLAFVKNIAVRSDLGDTFDEAGNPLDPALGV